MANRRRVFRIAVQLRELIARVILHLSDPRFRLVTITSVVVSPDLRASKVYWTVTGGGQRVEEVQEAFESAAGLLRSTIGKELGIRSVPELRFYYDDTLDEQERINALFERIKA